MIEVMCRPKIAPHLRVLEASLLDHHLRAAVLADGRRFLRGLEDETDRPGDLGAHAGEQLRHAHEDRGVRIVPAGVHHAAVLAVPLGADLAREGHVHFLGDRQGIHVRPQGHDRPGACALKRADDAGMGDLLDDLVEAEGAQVVGHDLRRARLAIAELGVLVEIAAPGDDLGFQPVGDLGDPRVEGKGFVGCVHGGIIIPPWTTWTPRPLSTSSRPIPRRSSSTAAARWSTCSWATPRAR
jgi:hypothetical protein